MSTAVALSLARLAAGEHDAEKVLRSATSQENPDVQRESESTPQELAAAGAFEPDDHPKQDRSRFDGLFWKQHMMVAPFGTTDAPGQFSNRK